MWGEAHTKPQASGLTLAGLPTLPGANPLGGDCTWRAQVTLSRPVPAPCSRWFLGAERAYPISGSPREASRQPLCHGEAGRRTSDLWTGSQHPASPSPSQQPLGVGADQTGVQPPRFHPNTGPNMGPELEKQSIYKSIPRQARGVQSNKVRCSSELF